LDLPERVETALAGFLNGLQLDEERYAFRDPFNFRIWFTCSEQDLIHLADYLRLRPCEANGPRHRPCFENWARSAALAQMPDWWSPSRRSVWVGVSLEGERLDDAFFVDRADARRHFHSLVRSGGVVELSADIVSGAEQLPALPSDADRTLAL
jgi:hypothetical protein